MSKSITFQVSTEKIIKDYEKILIVGSCQELGNWDTSKGINLKKISNQNIWISDKIEFHSANLPIEFKIIFKTAQSQNKIQWEQLPFDSNRVYFWNYYHSIVYLKKNYLYFDIIPNTYQKIRDKEKTLAHPLIHDFNNQQKHGDKESESTTSTISTCDTNQSNLTPIFPHIQNQADEKKFFESFNKNSFKSILKALKKSNKLISLKNINLKSALDQHQVIYPISNIDATLINKEEGVIFITMNLPVKVILKEVGEDKNASLQVEISYSDSNDFYVYCAQNFKMRYKKGLWFGFFPLSSEMWKYQDKISSLLFENFHMMPVFVELETSYQNLKKNWDSFYYENLTFMKNNNSDSNCQTNRNYDLEVFNHFNTLLVEFILQKLEKLQILSNLSNLYFIINDLELYLLPKLLCQTCKSNEKFQISFYVQNCFPSPENIIVAEEFDSIIRSLLLCNCILFNANQSAKHFLDWCQIHSIPHSFEKNGFLSIIYYGRKINITIGKPLLDYNYLVNVVEEHNIREECLKACNIIAIENYCYISNILQHLNLVKNVVDQFSFRFNINFIIKTILGNPKNQELNDILEFAEFLNSISKEKVFHIFLDPIPHSKRLTDLANADLFLDFNFSGKINIEFLEITAINKKNAIIFTNCCNANYLKLANNVEIINSFNDTDMINMINKIIIDCQIDQEEKKQIEIDIEAIKRKQLLDHQNIWNLIDSILLDMKRSTSIQKDAMLVKINTKKKIKYIATNKCFALKKSKLNNALSKSQSRLLIFSFESLFNYSLKQIFKIPFSYIKNMDSSFKNDIISQIKNHKIFGYLKEVANNSKNHLYIISLLSREILSELFHDILNIILFAEDGYYYAYTGPDMVWYEIHPINKNLNEIIDIFGKDHSLINAFDKFQDRASIYSYRFKSLTNFDELITNNFYKDAQKKKINQCLDDVELYKAASMVVAKSNVLPPCCIVEMVLIYEFLKYNQIEFFLGLLGKNFEDIFVELRRYLNNYQNHFKIQKNNTIFFFPVIIEPTITHAKYFVENEQDIVEILRLALDSSLAIKKIKKIKNSLFTSWR